MIKVIGEKALIFANEKDGEIRYTASLSQKTDKGGFEYGTIPVSFREGVEVKDKSRIDFEGWLSFNNYFIDKEKKTYIRIFVDKILSRDGVIEPPDNIKSIIDEFDVPF